MTHALTLDRIEPVTHDTYRLIFPRPEGYAFEPGQATDLALDRDGFREQTKPFTFTSQPEDEVLEFVIKTYPTDENPDHDGVTERIAGMTPGDGVLIGDAWGAITDKGPGVFIAGGAGVTPFIAILRRRAREGTLRGCKLIYANKTVRDIILKDEFDGMEGLETVYVVDGEEAEGYPSGPVDEAFLKARIADFDQPIYVCGPPKMTEAVVDALKSLGAEPDGITLEEK